jgi:hypothetical protein
MDTVLLVIVLLIPLIWFSAETIQSKRKDAASPDEYWGTVMKTQVDTNVGASQQTEHDDANNLYKGYSGRLYYSIPGRSFTGYIYKGRIARRR